MNLPTELTFCPDCKRLIATALFVEHREQEHPPSPRTIAAAGGIESQEHVGAPGGS